MRNHLIAALAGVALAACQQQSATEPAASETAAAATSAVPIAASATPAGQADAAAQNAVVPAPDAKPTAAADAEAAKPDSGYDWAEAHNIDDVKDCTEGDRDFREGCELYVNEKNVDEGEREFEGDGE